MNSVLVLFTLVAASSALLIGPPPRPKYNPWIQAIRPVVPLGPRVNYCTCRPKECFKGELTLNKNCQLTWLFPSSYNTCCRFIPGKVANRYYGPGPAENGPNDNNNEGSDDEKAADDQSGDAGDSDSSGQVEVVIVQDDSAGKPYGGGVSGGYGGGLGGGLVGGYKGGVTGGYGGGLGGGFGGGLVGGYKGVVGGYGGGIGGGFGGGLVGLGGFGGGYKGGVGGLGGLGGGFGVRGGGLGGGYGGYGAGKSLY